MRSGGQHHAQVAGLLDYPCSDRVGSDPGHVRPSGVELDEEQHVEALQQHRVDGEDVTSQHGGRLGSEELGPAWTCPHRRGIDAIPTKEGPGTRGSQHDARPGRLAQDPAIAPSWVLPGKTEDARYGASRNGPASWSMRFGPSPADQVPVPAEQARGLDEEPLTASTIKEPTQPSEHRSVG